MTAQLPWLTVRAARDSYLKENGFDLAGYTAATFDVEFFGRTMTFPNSPDRKWAIPLHDLHHTATGYGTDLVGEAEIGAFELRGGCHTGIVYALNLLAMTAGLLMAPVRTLRAFRAARGARTLFRGAWSYDEILALRLVELRARLGISEAGLASGARRLHDAAERALPTPLPTAPPIRNGVLALALAMVAGAVVVAATTLSHHVSCGVAVALLGLVLLAATWRARAGSLGARALAAHSALALTVVAAIELLR